MNGLYIGSECDVPPPKKGLFIHNKVPKIALAKVFDPKDHSFDLIEGLDYRRCDAFVASIDALFSRGENTLTKDTGLDFIFDRLEMKPKSLETLIPEPGRGATPGHIWAHSKIKALLRSPTLKRVFCRPTNFSFAADITLARIDRTELTEFEANAISLFLISRYSGPIFISDYGPLAHESHISLLRQGRFVIGVNSLSELPAKLRKAAEQIPDPVLRGASAEDAELFALRKGLVRGTNEFNDYVGAAVRHRTPQGRSRRT